MSPTTESTLARLGPLVIDLMRLVRTLRAEYGACAELLQLTLELVREQDRELDRVRAAYHRVLDQRRRERPAA